MKKNRNIVIIIAVVIVAILAVITVFTVRNINEQKQIENFKNQINSLLEMGDYAEVYSLYSEQSDEYKQAVESEIYTYIQQLCADGEQNLSTETLLALKDIGFEYEIIDEAIIAITEKQTELLQAQTDYQSGIEYYSVKEYDTAETYFEKITAGSEFYSDALVYISYINKLQDSWNNNSYGRRPYLNSYAYDGEYLYVPYTVDKTDGIYKISDDGSSTQFIPISSGETRVEISGINVVGDYIYFIAGENVGSGYIFENPYNIYRINKDGTDMVLEVEGNFTDLIVKGTTAYAISREYGLIEYNKYLAKGTVISEADVIEFSCADEGLYYTVRESLEYNSDNIIYYYDGQESVEVDRGESMHFFSFDDRYLKWWAQTESKEMINLGDSQGETKIAYSDIVSIYGILDEKVVYARTGKVYQPFEHVYDISTGEVKSKNGYSELPEYITLGMFYEGSKLVIEKDGKLYFSDAYGDVITEIAIPRISQEQLAVNMEKLPKLQDKDIYSSEDEDPLIAVIEDKQYWHYKDSSLNLYIEKRYLDQYDTNVYVTHIFTNDYSLFKTGNGTGYDSAVKTYRANYISDKYQMIYAQNTDTFLDGRNVDRGIVIRNSEILRDTLLYDMLAYYDDGHMEIFRRGDDITGEKLLETGVVLSFSFGPVLVENYQIVNNCAFDGLADRNPRSAIGYVEPGHYVMIVCDGRDEKVSRGLSMYQLAEVFKAEGCQIAYNLDGGTTSTITFFGNYITRRTAYPNVPEIYNHRNVAELFYFGASDMSPLDLTDYTYNYENFLENYK